MKIQRLLFIQIFFLSSVFSLAQQRGFKQVDLHIDGKSNTLYTGSHALIIGVSDYTAGWPDLPGVVADIKNVSTALEKHDFNVTTVMNPTDRQMEDAFEDFINKYGSEKDVRLVFYFAGHGHTIKTSYGEELGYIVPANAINPNHGVSDFQRRAMEMAQIEIFAKRIQSKHALFLFDACFSGSLFALSRAIPEDISWKTSRHVRQFITSGSADETVPDRSIFCSQFTAAINGEADLNGDNYITGTELGEFLQSSVVNYSRNAQHPQYGKIRNPNLDKGDFVFVLNKREMENLPPSQVTFTEEKITRYGSIQLTTEINGNLYLDGVFIKTIAKDTRITLNDVSSGSHILKITGDHTWQESVSVGENITTRTTAKATIPKNIPTAGHDFKRKFDWEPEMIFVKGGTYTMGCVGEQSDCDDDEIPSHKISLDDFYLGVYEVTQEQWREVMGNNQAYFPSCDNCPVEDVNWNEAQMFINKLNQKTGKKYRLPTEAEWEYAAKGGSMVSSESATKYAGSDDVGNVAWFYNNSNGKPHPVGEKKPNELGIYDMSGNVNEWCSDWYGENYYKSSPGANPKGPSSGTYRCNRGGSWYGVLRVTHRGWNNSSFRNYSLGFRLVCD